ncbi:primosomal protein DnaI [Paenalkalicoccus suaedae]|uniref:Primosomal protein DnaI n=1 Tax=Paenalkalicoccus suaedae TaxID=2592382 RepID=A0A859FGS2_9BACI|nr:primosomal protein DnaI [Paenalkalicoccus suaedae]QKS72018.1 primosomal protein DnaI [Paenalkalicoccus suaedae]
MDPINKPLRQFANDRLGERMEKMRADILQDRRVQAFIEDNEEWAQENLEAGLNELYQYKTQWHNCDHCPGLFECPNLVRGYQPKLEVVRNSLQVTYESCSLKRKDDERRRQASFIQSLYIPKEMTTVTFDDFYEESSRMDAYTTALEFCSSIAPGENGEGLYIHGSFGVGKTFLVGAIANELADQEVRTMLVYTPDFLRELKSGISDGSYQAKLDMIKKAPVLILDDIGAESMSQWVRDDILGSLLQFRMMEKLPTVFTSNFNLEELEIHLSQTNRGGVERVDQLKARRIMERIKYLNKEIEMKGNNKRQTP